MNRATQEELDFYKQQNVYGICSDYVGEFRWEKHSLED
jgi:hypothetical protein